MEIVEVGHDGCKDGMVKCAVEDCLVKPSIGQNSFACKPVQGEVHGAFFLASEDEVMEVEHLLLEPQIEKDLSNDIMLMSSEHAKECLAIEDFTFVVDSSDQKTDFGNTYSDAALMRKHEFVDSMFHEFNEGDLHIQSNFCSICPDFVLDTGYAENFQVKCASQSTSCIRNFELDLQTKLMERPSDAGEISDLSNTLNSPHEAASGQDAFFLDNVSTDQFPDAFRSNFGWDTSVKDKQSLKHHMLCGSQNFTETDNFCSPFHSFSTPNENDDEMIWIPNNLFEGVSSPFGSVLDSSKIAVEIGPEKAGHGGDVQVGNFSGAHKGGFELLHLEDEESAGITNKRLRKPTRRYIEETSDSKSRCCKEARGSVTQKSRDLCASRGHPRKIAAVMGSETIIKDEFLSSVESRTTYALQFSKAESRNNTSEDWIGASRNETSGIRRKHHRLWTLPEVLKLIEGVSRYGVGRWTEIKRLLFSTSAFRTSVDLKDKWRNLLRASAAQLHNRKQVGPHKKHMSLPIPQYVLRRIRELSVIHPYPRDRKSRDLPVSSSPVYSSSNDISSSHSGWTLHKRSFT